MTEGLLTPESTASRRRLGSELAAGRWWLRDDIAVRVGYDDRTLFGGPMTSRPCRGVRAIFAAVFDYVKDHGFDDLLHVAPALLAQVVSGKAFAEIAESDDDGWRIRSQVLYPDVAASRPRWLTFASPAMEPVTTEVPAPDWRGVHTLLTQLTYDGYPDGSVQRSAYVAELFGRLQDAALLEAQPAPSPGPDLGLCDLTIVGHNTVAVRTKRTTIIVDPFMFPASPSYPDSYQPLGLRRLGSVDAVLITHAHPDHFDPASLLRLPPDVQVVVPVVERETILGADMAYRLHELGFTNVTALGWDETITVGDIVVHARPFFGEQPTDGQVLHPQVRNQGNTYVVTTPTFSAAFLADSGRDHLGDVRDVAETWRREHGPVDVVFAGYRGWATYPVQLLFSSVAAFFLFVPRSLWTARFRLMTDAADAVDVAERWGARYLVPYADGGAPWYWEVGLGPRLDGSGTEDPNFDPYPERVLDVARNRVSVPGGPTLPSPVPVLLLRPGDSLLDTTGAARVLRLPGHTWPYAEIGDVGSGQVRLQ